MTTGVTRGALAVGLAVASLAAGAAGAGAVSTSGDVALAKQGVLVAADLPEGWSGANNTGLSDAAVIKVAKTVPGCAKYIALKNLTHATPQARSLDWSDTSRDISNEVDVFANEAKARAALALYANPTVAKCLDGLFTKVLTSQFAKEPTLEGKVKKVSVDITKQPITGLGDESVVYEGNATVTLKDGTQQTIGLGNAAVRVGRVASDYSYSTTDAALPDVLQPAIDSSLARLQSAAGSAG